MTREEMKMILTPAVFNYQREWGSYELSDLINFWYASFGNCDYETVNRAFNAHMATSSFAPKIADINRQIQKMESPEPLGETEAFNRILKAVERSSWHSQEEFEKLDPILQKIVGDAHQLQDWASMTVDDIMRNVRPMVARDYRAEVERQQEYARLPEDVRKRIDEANARKSVYDGRLIEKDEAVNE